MSPSIYIHSSSTKNWFRVWRLQDRPAVWSMTHVYYIWFPLWPVSFGCLSVYFQFSQLADEMHAVN